MADLIQHPHGTWGLECVRSSLATSYALIAFRDGRIEDEAVGKALLHGADAQPLRKARSDEAALWHQTHDPAVVAAHQLRSCMGWQGVELVRSPLWRACLRKTEAISLLSLYRHTGRTRPAAIEAASSEYAGEWSPDALGVMAERVYAAPTRADDVRIREQLLGECLAPASH